MDDFLDAPGGEFEWGQDTRRRRLQSKLSQAHRTPTIYLLLIGVGAAVLAISIAVAWAM